MLEREHHLSILCEHVQQAAAGHGRLLFLAAEAGGGKTTLVEQLAAAVRQQTQVNIISCDGPREPGPLGPLFDIASALGPEVEALLHAHASRDRIFRSVISALEQATHPGVLVGEDAHWTDEASLDLIRFLGRRIANTRTLLIVTYRDDALDTYHPLRRTIGDLINEPSVYRMTLPPLSLEAVTTLAHGTPIDPVTIHQRTSGNPFYVTEVLAGDGTTMPESVRDAVLGRAAGISMEGRAVLDAAATLGVAFDPDLLAAVMGEPVVEAIDECLAAGMFRPFGDQIAFRHGLTRDVFLHMLSAPRRRGLHRRILEVLETEPDFATDAAHLAHHAEEARDTARILNHAQRAAAEAVTFGAHRQAAAQYARALRFAHTLPAVDQAALLEARSYECYLTGNLEDAIADQGHARVIREASGDRLRIGDNQRWLSRFCWFAGRNAEAEHHAQAALDTLETLPPSHELAMAYSNLSQLRMLAYETDEAIQLGRCAIAHARAVDDQATLVHAHINVGTAMIMSCDVGGREVLEQSIRTAKALHLDDDVARGLANLAWTATDHYELDLAERTLAKGVAFTCERDLVAMERYLRAGQARVQLARGDWQAAGENARSISSLPGATRLTRIVTLTVEGRVAARSGADASSVLDEALTLAKPTGEFMRLGPLRAARAEAAWLAGDSALACAEIDTVYTQALAAGECWLVGELALWLHRGGRVITDTSNLAEPFALEIGGDGIAAASIWSALGCPLEEARALASTGKEEHLLRALAIVDQLGAKPDLARITRLLRCAGATTIPRGPRPETRANPALLTSRELDVAELLVQGRSNREIANVLFLSPRTVGHHVSAILGKLQVDSRLQVPARMRELEIGQDRSLTIPI